MPRTCSAYLDDLKHVLRVVLQFPADGEVEKSLINEGYVSLDDFLSMTNEDLDDFDVVLDDTTHRFLHKPEKGKVQAFQSFVIWRGSEGLPIAEDEWQSITFDEFHHYRLSPEFIAVRIGVRPPPDPRSTSAIARPSTPASRNRPAPRTRIGNLHDTSLAAFVSEYLPMYLETAAATDVTSTSVPSAPTPAADVDPQPDSNT